MIDKYKSWIIVLKLHKVKNNLLNVYKFLVGILNRQPTIHYNIQTAFLIWVEARAEVSPGYDWLHLPEAIRKRITYTYLHIVCLLSTLDYRQNSDGNNLLVGMFCRKDRWEKNHTFFHGVCTLLFDVGPLLINFWTRILNIRYFLLGPHNHVIQNTIHNWIKLNHTNTITY